MHAEVCQEIRARKFKPEAASTHRSAKTRRQCFCSSWPWLLKFWPQNKWVSRTRRARNISKSSWGLLIWSYLRRFFDTSCVKTDRQTYNDENPIPATTVGVSNQSRPLIKTAHIGWLVEFLLLFRRALKRSGGNTTRTAKLHFAMKALTESTTLRN